MVMNINLQIAIESVASIIPPEADDWWIIGSAAMVLSGVETEARDVDIFGSKATISATVEALVLDPLPPSNDPLFRSTVFARHQPADAVPIEFMGGFEVSVRGAWRPFEIHSRRRIDTALGPVFVPELDEQIAILEMFGRDKDLRRAGLIRDFLYRRGL